MEQRVRINQPRPSARELEEGAGRMSASRQLRMFANQSLWNLPRRALAHLVRKNRFVRKWDTLTRS